MRILATVVAVLAFGATASWAQAPPAASYGSLPAISDVAISPDGQRLAIANTIDGQSLLRVVNIESGAVEHTAAAQSGTKLRGVGWADDNHALFYTSQTMRTAQILPRGAYMRGSTDLLEYWRVGVYSRANGRQTYVEPERGMGWANPGLTQLIAPIDGDPGAGRMLAYSPAGFTVYRINLNNGSGDRMYYGDPDTIDVLLNERGEIGAQIDSDQTTNRWRLQLREGDRRRTLLSGQTPTGAPPGFAGFLEDGRIAVADRLGDEERERFYAVSTSNGEAEVLAEHEIFDVNRAIADPWTHRIVGAEWVEDLPQQRFFNADLAQIAERVRGHFEDGFATLHSWSRDRSKVIVFAETNNDAGSYFLYEPATDAMRLIARQYAELTTDAALGQRQAIRYRARDGVQVPAYLTLPAGGATQNLPLVLLVHGGPHARDNFTFDWWASFLASRGYAVLQPNYRGSTGYGDAWFTAGQGGWGDGVMQTDVIDGVDALVRAHIADPQRVCIVGASYGGYAALAGATLTPDKFRCAVSVAGVSDLMAMLNQTDRESGSEGMASDWWRLSIGDRRADAEHLRSVSPANRAADVTAPILLLHGANDTVVPLSQSRTMHERLEAAGKPHRFVIMPGDDHWLSVGATRTQMLSEIEQFLAENLAPQQP
jgi:dipeptidyl aminopeptidase/acylaminoacyl peptidase